MKKILILTKDPYLGQKIALELGGTDAAVTVARTPCEGDFDAVLADVREPFRVGDVPRGAHTLGDGGELPLPLPVGAAEVLFAKRDGIDLDRERSVATVRGRTVVLTEVECALLAALAERRGALASREELLLEVWHGEATESVLNVYVHYLREKLEKGGERIILSERGGGYRLREDLFGGDGVC